MVVHRLKELVQHDFDAYNGLIQSKIQAHCGMVENIVSHIIRGGGKQIRPLIAILSSRACGYEGEAHITLAAMVEFLHTATLLHDDVIDESKLRRGRETANEIWGDKLSILVGDYLFTQYVQMMISFDDVKINQLMTDTAFHISFGELLQYENRRQHNLTEDEYFNIISAKTSRLFAASASVAAMISKKGAPIEQSLYDYGLHLGHAFQLIDDALDYCADASVFGKNIGDDLVYGIPTLPLLHALKHGTPTQQEKIKQSLKEGSLAHLPDILLAIEETKAIQYTVQIAKAEVDKAVSALQPLPNSEYKTALADLAHYVASRDH